MVSYLPNDCSNYKNKLITLHCFLHGISYVIISTYRTCHQTCYKAVNNLLVVRAFSIINLKKNYFKISIPDSMMWFFYTHIRWLLVRKMLKIVFNFKKKLIFSFQIVILRYQNLKTKSVFKILHFLLIHIIWIYQILICKVKTTSMVMSGESVCQCGAYNYNKIWPIFFF